MANSLSALVSYLAPVFLITSPITSYADQVYSIHRTRTSAGFSLDIPLIMLVASILKVFFWITDHYSLVLLTQAVVMIFAQSLLLHVSLVNRPATAPTVYQPFSDHHHNPHAPGHVGTDPAPPSLFAALAASVFHSSHARPYNFWRWRSTRPYWSFLVYFTGALLVLQLFLGPTVPTFLSVVQSGLALTIEALLPVPQLLSNYQRKGCKGFRLSVIVNWVVGDAFKMWWFVTQGRDKVPLPFIICGVFQACCDLGLGVQYWIWGEGRDYAWDKARAVDKEGLGDVEMEDRMTWMHASHATQPT